MGFDDANYQEPPDKEEYEAYEKEEKRKLSECCCPEGDFRFCHGEKQKLLLQMREMQAEAERKDLIWEGITVENLEAVTELTEALAPFYLHGMALRGTVLPENATINRVGSSFLVKGAFETAIEAFQKWQELLEPKEIKQEKRIPVVPMDPPGDQQRKSVVVSHCNVRQGVFQCLIDTGGICNCPCESCLIVRSA